MFSGFEHRIDDMANHWKDRHVLAAAVHAGADLLITFNLEDFPDLVPETGIRVLHPDAFLLDILREKPAVVMEVLAEKVEQHRREPKTPAGLMAVLAKTVPAFSAEVMRRGPGAALPLAE